MNKQEIREWFNNFWKITDFMKTDESDECLQMQDLEAFAKAVRTKALTDRVTEIGQELGEYE